MFWLEGPAIEAHLAGPTPFGGLQAQDPTITHTPKGVAGLPGREQNCESQAGAACQCMSTKAPLNKLAIAGHHGL